MNYTFSPKEAYLIEQFTSLEFFEVMRSNYQKFINELEELLEIYMHNLPYNLRSLPLPEQADIVWGETVLPNLRETMQRINIAYEKIKNGDFTYLFIAAEIRSNDKGMSEFSYHWLDDMPTEKVIECFKYHSLVGDYASVIENTYPTYWEKGELDKIFPSAEIFHNIDIKLPDSYPIYKVNPSVQIHSNMKVVRTGIYISDTESQKIAFMAASDEKDSGFASSIGIQDSHTGEFIYHDCLWTLLERIADAGNTIADEGESLEAKKTRLKGYSGDICPESGNWWSPANQSQYHHFEKGEIFPKIENSEWGETVWYMEVNKQNG